MEPLGYVTVQLRPRNSNGLCQDDAYDLLVACFLGSESGDILYKRLCMSSSLYCVEVMKCNKEPRLCIASCIK